MDRLHKLLAMAKSPVEEEARTAALMAVRLIHEHKIELRLPSKGYPIGVTEPLTSWDWKPSEPAKPKPPSTPPPKPPPRVPKYQEVPVSLVAKFGGVCKQCARHYSAGESILWLKGRGATHYNCQTYWYK
jgi:hypothetical protein